MLARLLIAEGICQLSQGEVGVDDGADVVGLELQASNASIFSLRTSSAVPVAGKLCASVPSTKRSVA